MEAPYASFHKAEISKQEKVCNQRQQNAKNSAKNSENCCVNA